MNFGSKSILLSTSNIPFRHCSNSVLDRVTSTHRIDILHSNTGTSICVPSSVVRHLLTSDVHFTSFHFPCIMSDMVIGSPTTRTNVRPKSDVVTLGKAPVSFSSFGRTVTRHGGGTTALLGSDVSPHFVALTCIHNNIASALDVHISSTCLVKMATYLIASHLLPVIGGRCTFLRSFPTNISLNIGALGNCINGVGCLFSGRKTGRLNNFKAVNDVFPTA